MPRKLVDILACLLETRSFGGKATKRRRHYFLVTLLIGLLSVYGLIQILTTYQVHFSSKDKQISNGRGGPDTHSMEKRIHVIHSNDIPVRHNEPLFRGDVDIHFNNGHDEQRGQADRLINSNMLPNSPNDAEASKVTNIKIPYKLVHLDLKGAPVHLNYYEKIFPMIAQAGANTLLLEYEDMFPFTQPLLNGTSHLFPYNKSQIKELLRLAEKHNLEVIPLIQTFGHLEFILKLEQYAHLREVPEFPQEICPSNEASWALLKEMIRQVMALHPKSRYIHIGCDEVWHIGQCSRCKNKNTKKLFLDHVSRVADFIHKEFRVSSIIWDDMLRKFYTEELVQSGIGQKVEIMIWDYTEQIDHLVPPFLWPMYTNVFPNIWIASAFKGAFGESLFQVPIKRHAGNHLSWLRTVQREWPRIRNFRGIAITGWSRYDHFSVLCELLPVALPSLLLNLYIINHGEQSAEDTYTNALRDLGLALKCDLYDRGDMMTPLQLNECIWPGKDAWSIMEQLKDIQDQYKEFSNSWLHSKGWLTYYNIKHNETSPWRLEEPTQISMQLMDNVKTLEVNARSILKEYYDPYIINEWIEQKIEKMRLDLQKVLKQIHGLGSRKYWSRRPIA